MCKGSISKKENPTPEKGISNNEEEEEFLKTRRRRRRNKLRFRKVRTML
jgi:hypothetical protein